MTLTPQQGIRLLMGCDFDIETAVNKSRDVANWRETNNLSNLRNQIVQKLSSAQGTAIRFPHHKVMCSMLVANPCVLMTTDGSPISIWHAGMANTIDVECIDPNHLASWSRVFFEYVDVWVSEYSEQHGRLAVHIQIYNMDGLSLWTISNTTLIEKLKVALSPGQYYVETISHIYVINAGMAFKAAWRLAKALITPRTESKISVTNRVPEALLQRLGPGDAQRLSSAIEKREPAATVQRPPIIMEPDDVK